jgi:hypothetical protein
LKVQDDAVKPYDSLMASVDRKETRSEFQRSGAGNRRAETLRAVGMNPAPNLVMGVSVTLSSATLSKTATRDWNVGSSNGVEIRSSSIVQVLPLYVVEVMVRRNVVLAAPETGKTGTFSNSCAPSRERAGLVADQGSTWDILVVQVRYDAHQVECMFRPFSRKVPALPTRPSGGGGPQKP